ncbi:TPA: RNA polymerase subunit sigma, partial [Pseudomonas aeruginosa]|nr:RNA polymerase subunit sigma [Pseudomonas aeruginosa]
MDSQGSIKNTLIAQLFQQNYDWLCKKLSYQTGCSHSAEDLAAEAFLQVWMLPDPAS